MPTQFTLDGVVYTVEDFSAVGRELISRLFFVNAHIKQLNNNVAIFNKAKNAYIEDLKYEAIENKSGINLSDLFSSD